ncbi:MAG: 6-carboxytetrahydropterin synthase [candidate division NC10 bacterium]|nr:6-carboxytetrahydropterin synthase [candidate division NC10 bacterium]
MAGFRIRIDQDYLKFSSAHFLLFANGECERLHGHNYRAWVELEGSLEPNDYVFDFITVKPLMKQICDRLDHRVLLPTENADLRIEKGDSVIGAAYFDKQYRFPTADVLLLPIHNTSAELLARYICGELKQEIKARFGGRNLSRIKVGVQESFGQEAAYEDVF